MHHDASYSPCRVSIRSMPNMLLLLTAAAAVALQSFCADAVIINGRNMSVDQAIMAASEPSGSVQQMENANVVRVEMDMLFPSEVWESIIRERENGTRRHRRKILRDQQYRWPSAVVPFKITAHFSSEEMQQFNEALEEYHRYTCIRFRQAVQTDSDYVDVKDGGECSSVVGRRGGEQLLSLAKGCRNKRVIIHELGHAVGFHHEQTRPDRDNYIRILAENVDSSKLNNFRMHLPEEVDVFSVPYDYLSVMHYGQYAFSNNGRQSINTIDPAYQDRIGNRGGFSFSDVKAANLMYSCAELKRCRKKVCPRDGFVAQDCRCWCSSSNESIAAEHCPDCLDYDSYCQAFKKRGLCSTVLFRSYMQEMCPRTCGYCQ